MFIYWGELFIDAPLPNDCVLGDDDEVLPGQVLDALKSQLYAGVKCDHAPFCFALLILTNAPTASTKSPLEALKLPTTPVTSWLPRVKENDSTGILTFGRLALVIVIVLLPPRVYDYT